MEYKLIHAGSSYAIGCSTFQIVVCMLVNPLCHKSCHKLKKHCENISVSD